MRQYEDTTLLEMDRRSVSRFCFMLLAFLEWSWCVIYLIYSTALQTHGTDAPSCCYFNVAEKIVGYHVSSAKLYFYVSPAKVVQNTLHQMTIKMITARLHPPGQTKLRLVANIKVQLSLRVGAWRSVDFTRVVQGWAAEPETNLGIVLELEDDAGNSVLITETSTEEPRVSNASCIRSDYFFFLTCLIVEIEFNREYNARLIREEQISVH